MHTEHFYTLVASSPDRVGIVARVAGLIAEHQGWILETSHYSDADTGRYFMRIDIKADSLPFDLAEFRRRFITLRGWQDGLHGLWLALLFAWYYGFMPYWILGNNNARI